MNRAEQSGSASADAGRAAGAPDGASRVSSEPTQGQASAAAPGRLIEIAIAVVEHSGRYLVGQRPTRKPLAGLWEFPGGKVEPGETAAEAAVRETREETGLEIVLDALIEQLDHRYEHAALRLYFFAAHLADPHAAPLARFRWCSRSELQQLEFPAANRPILDRLL